MVVAKRIEYMDRIKGLDSREKNGITAYEKVPFIYFPDEQILISKNGCDCVLQTPLHEAYDVIIGEAAGKRYRSFSNKMEREMKRRKRRDDILFMAFENGGVRYEETELPEEVVRWAEARYRYRALPGEPLPPILENPPESVKSILRPKL